MHDAIIHLICLPPCSSLDPLAGLTAIKSYLKVNNIKCEVNYLNIEIDRDCFFKNDLLNENKSLLPYVYLYNKHICLDSTKSESVKKKILLFYSNYFHLDKSIADELFEEEINALYKCMENRIDILLKDNPLIIGFTNKFYQWIPAVLCADLIKKKKNIKTIIGGWTLKDEAISIIESHDVFDYAIWGEGELPILKLYESIKNNKEIENIPRLTYRKNGISKFSLNNNNPDSFINLNDAPYYDISDYLKQSNQKIEVFPIERIRGCNWNKCKFCYLSQGYNYRGKKALRFLAEIEYYIKEYGIYKFQLMDNDFIGSNYEEFITLLIELKKIKEKYPNFEITMVEIIPQNLTSNTIELMAQTGITNAQIGLESISPTLLTKMRKKQSVAENLFYIKEAYKFKMNVSGLNIIINTLDENDNDISESIETLYFFRFFMNIPEFSLNISQLAVANNSYYFRQLKKINKLSEFDYNPTWEDLSKKMFQNVDKYSLFDFFQSKSRNELWEHFSHLQNSYRNLKYKYTIIYKKNCFIYREFSKQRLVKKIVFDDKVTILIMILLQDKVLSSSDLLYAINKNNMNISEYTLQSVINDLYREGLVFYTENYKHITTIINIDKNSLNQ
jgi:radical SAM superfamily enzyme YgiQ (UPF0313 family)